jgi:hypothetical protein
MVFDITLVPVETINKNIYFCTSTTISKVTFHSGFVFFNFFYILERNFRNLVIWNLGSEIREYEDEEEDQQHDTYK